MDRREDLYLEGSTGTIPTETEGNRGAEVKRDARRWKSNNAQLAWGGSPVSFVLLAALGVLVRGLVLENLAGDFHACCLMFQLLGKPCRL